MKISFFQLRTLLAKQLLPLYLITAEDIWLRQQAEKNIEAQAQAFGYLEKRLLTVEASDLSGLYNQLRTRSLFAEKQIFLLRHEKTSLPKDAMTFIDKWCEAPLPDSIFILSLPKFTAAELARAWVKKIDTQGAIVHCFPPTSQETKALLQESLQAHQLTADAEVINLLLTFYEGNLLALMQAVTQLSLLFPQGRLAVIEVTQALQASGRYSVFELADQVLQGDVTAVDKSFAYLRASKVEPILILWALHRDLQILSALAAMPQESETTLQKMGVWPKRRPLFKKALQRFDEKRCEQGLCAAQRLDFSLKG